MSSTTTMMMVRMETRKKREGEKENTLPYEYFLFGRRSNKFTYKYSERDNWVPNYHTILCTSYDYDSNCKYKYKYKCEYNFEITYIMTNTKKAAGTIGFVWGWIMLLMLMLMTVWMR